jgi:hypothetical protein
MVGRSLEDGDFDTIEAGRLDVLQERLVAVRNVRRPQEHAHADLHGTALPDASG